MTHDSAREVIARALDSQGSFWRAPENAAAMSADILSALQSAGYAVVPVEVLRPFLEAIRNLDADTEPNMRAPDDMPIGDAIYELEQPTVGDLRAMLTASDSGQEKGK